MSQLPQIRLRSFFLIFICVAVGLTCATSPKFDYPLLRGIYVANLNFHYGLLVAASTAIIIALTQQVRYLTKSVVSESWGTELRFGHLCAICWRLAIAAVLFVCLIVQLLISRLVLPEIEHNDYYPEHVFPEAIILTAIIIILAVSVSRFREQNRRKKSSFPLRLVLSMLAGIALLLVVLPNLGFMSSLVHIATHGIEIAGPIRFHRPETFPDQAAQGFRLFWLSLSTVFAVLLSAVGLAFVCTKTLTSRARFVLTTFCLSLLAASTIFCVWYYKFEYPLLSPDFASVELASNLSDWLGGGALICIIAGSVSFKWAERREPQPVSITADETSIAQLFPYESLLCLLCLFASFVALAVERFREYYPRGAAGLLDFMSVLIAGSDSYLALALAILCVQLAWLRWRLGENHTVFQITAIDRNTLALSFAAIALVILIAIPTFSIYSFVFWLGPWYKFG